MKRTFISQTLRLLMTIVCTVFCLSAEADTEFTETINGAKLKFYVRDNHPDYADVNGFASGNTFSGVLTLPATFVHNGTSYKIQNISGFSGCSNITGVDIASASLIDYQAFKGCPNLKSVKISSFYNSYYNAGLGQQCFMNCSELTEVVLPREKTGGGTYVFSWPFWNCSKLTDITVTNGVSTRDNSYYSNNGVLFKNTTTNNTTTKSIVYYCEGRSATSYSIPYGMNEISEHCFAYNSHLKSLSIPSSVKTLGDGMCHECISLNSVNIPFGVTEIPFTAFHKCGALTSVILPDGLTSIGNYAFYSTGLTTIKLPKQVTEIGYMAFDECLSLTQLISKNPTAPECGNDAFYNPGNINLTVPVGSDYGNQEPWRSMKITYSDDILDKYGIRVAGTEVNELNYNDVLKNGGKVSFRNDILTLNNVDISYSGGRLIENYGVDELNINVVGNCSLTSPSNHPFLFQKSTTIYGDTLTVSGLSTIESYEPVTLANTAFIGIASKKMFTLPALTIFGTTAFIGYVGDNATIGYIGNLNLGAGSELVAFERGHNLTFDSNEQTILDNGEPVAGGTNFSVGMPYPLYYNGIHLTTATNLLYGDYFQMIPGIEGGYILKGRLYGVSSGETPVLRSVQDGLELDLEGESYVIAAGSAPAIELNGNASFGGTGSLKVVSSENAGIYISRGRLTIENLDLDIRGYTAGIKGLAKYGTNYLANLELINVAGTIMATSSGSPSIMTVNTLTLEDCHAVNGASFNSSSHNVDAQQLVLARNQNVPTGIDDELVSVEERQEAKDSKLYDLQGHRVLIPQPRHIYIIRNADGSTHKVVAQ